MQPVDFRPVGPTQKRQSPCVGPPGLLTRQWQSIAGGEDNRGIGDTQISGRTVLGPVPFFLNPEPSPTPYAPIPFNKRALPNHNDLQKYESILLAFAWNHEYRTRNVEFRSIGKTLRPCKTSKFIDFIILQSLFLVRYSEFFL